MGRREKYPDDLLLEAVVRYSDVCKTKIKASELARWSRENVKGLEDVKDYHFTRPVKNKRTKKNEKKECTKRIEEINTARSIQLRESKNVILSSCSIDKFYELDEIKQRKVIADTRNILQEYKSTNRYLQRKYNQIEIMSAEIEKKTDVLEGKIRCYKKAQSKLNNYVKILVNNYNEEILRNKLAEIGISDGKFDLLTYNNSLKQDLDDIFDLDSEIRNLRKKMECYYLEEDNNTLEDGYDNKKETNKQELEKEKEYSDEELSGEEVQRIDKEKILESLTDF